ncbi:uncharacterized protein LOC118197131 isoform X2 [Stegodyphus dumicola]|uniref:uncharacterized protein LOC118197131 isoform X2 n=1 Tax=Stegodyphus dumicola TaxID=202533 RepID=UPI0015B29F45|nr:uncharacterized protein LOC118197131 isoform X2 [Stegodyphus dumicola]
MFKVWEKGVDLYENMRLNKCLCMNSTHAVAKDVFLSVYHASFESTDGCSEERIKCQLLCASILRLAGEIYTNEAAKHHSVCKEIDGVLSLFLENSTWNILVQNFYNIQDKYLVWAFIKALTALLYCLSKTSFKKHLEVFLQKLEMTGFDESNVPVLELLISLVNNCLKSPSITSNKSKCRGAVHCIVESVKDLCFCCCVELSIRWELFVKQFREISSFSQESKVLNSFLVLWKSFSEIQLSEDKNCIFFNEQFAVEFLFYPCGMSVTTFELYLDVIMQIFCSSIKYEPWQQLEKDTIEQTVAAAVSEGFFDRLPCYEISGVCSMNTETCNKSSIQVPDVPPKCNLIIIRKVTYIFLNILCEVNNVRLLHDALQKTFAFVKDRANAACVPVYIWIVDTFIDQDDLLFGAMLALLKIYINVNKSECIEKESFYINSIKQELNPHKIFISFLRQMGYDHNELLAFLTSDETCVLLYLVQYLKCVLSEWEVFVESHTSASNKERTGKGSVIDSIFASPQSSLDIAIVTPLQVSVPEKQLVSYSCSSSSDEEGDLVTKSGIFNPSNLKDSKISVYSTLSVLTRLREGIQKLVHVKEFPYNVLPLINLLKTCEEYGTAFA